MFDSSDIQKHQIAALIFAAVSVWISLCMILRLWIVHRKASLLKKLWWTVVLLIPLFGWLAYGGGFRIPASSRNYCRDEHSSDAPYIGGGHV